MALSECHLVSIANHTYGYCVSALRNCFVWFDVIKCTQGFFYFVSKEKEMQIGITVPSMQKCVVIGASIRQTRRLPSPLCVIDRGVSEPCAFLEMKQYTNIRIVALPDSKKDYSNMIIAVSGLTKLEDDLLCCPFSIPLAEYELFNRGQRESRKWFLIVLGETATEVHVVNNGLIDSVSSAPRAKYLS